MQLTVVEDAVFQKAYDLLKSCKQHLKMCDFHIRYDKSIGLSFMTLAYIDYRYLEEINFSQKLSYTSIQFSPFLRDFNNHKKQVESFLISPEDYDFHRLFKTLYRTILELEEWFEEKLNNPFI